MYYLLKTEPSTYSFQDLQREKRTVWDGVTNPQALKFLRGMNKADQLVIYHTGDERQAVGTATVTAVDIADAKVPRITISAGQELKRKYTLAELKVHRLFSDSPLVKNSRLSVVPLTETQWKMITS